MRSIEAQDPERQLALYWAGKEDREEYIATGLVKESRVERVAEPRVRAAGGGGGSRKRKSRHSQWSDSELEDGNFDCDEDYGKNRWNSVNRSERYKARCKDRGECPLLYRDGFVVYTPTHWRRKFFVVPPLALWRRKFF